MLIHVIYFLASGRLLYRLLTGIALEETRFLIYTMDRKLAKERIRHVILL
jgi:hypothetical protein